ncbi:MAG: hypothetical protein KF712_13285 [Akkermansiaceae bacterium]|nr:hypothetical protein [Akkermansiaceae bacterium]
MSKAAETTLIVPGEAGWEIWTGTAAGFTLKEATDIQFPGDIPDLPGTDLIQLFPVKSVTAIPMKVTSDDEALFPDLALLHAERLGIRPDPMAGQLTDLFVIGREPEGTALLSVFLRSPGEGEIPARTPKEFDLSARAFPLAGDSLAVWKELGRWVFSLSSGGNTAYCQATSISTHAPDQALAREIRLALIQLSIQGIDIRPSKIFVWTSDSETSASALIGEFRATAEVAPRPAPVLPAIRSKLLPADVRAARKAAEKKRNITLAVAAVVLAYLGVIGWFGYGVWKDVSRTKSLRAQAEEAAPDAAAFTIHSQKWDELALTREENSPVELLLHIANSIPPNTGLRLRTAEISAAEVKLIGEATQPGPINQFSLNLTKKNELIRFDWQRPSPQQSTRGWEFTYNAVLR